VQATQQYVVFVNIFYKLLPRNGCLLLSQYYAKGLYLMQMGAFVTMNIFECIISKDTAIDQQKVSTRFYIIFCDFCWFWWFCM